MASPAARTALIFRSRSSALTRVWRSNLRSLPSGVLHFRRYYSDGRLDGRVPPSPDSTSTAHLSEEFPPAASTTRSIRPSRSVFHRDAYPYPGRKYEGHRMMIPVAVSEVQRTPAAFDEAEKPVNNHDRASKNVAAQESKLGFVRGTEQRVGIASSASPPGGNTRLASATTTSRAIAALKNRQQQGLSIDSYTLIDVLRQCTEQKDLLATRQVHECIIQSELDKHPRVATTLLNVYIKLERLQDARRVFDGLQKTHLNVITWNVMIGAYARSGHGAEAHRLFLEMNREGFIPNAITCLSILNASASAGALEWVKDVHSHALKAGLESDLRVGTALVRMYAKTGSFDNARLIFDRMEKRDVITWNVMIGAYAESGRGVQAYKLFDLMRREGLIPNASTCLSILNASASPGALEWVKDVHSCAREAGLVSSHARVGTALVRMYAKSGSIDEARLVFDQMEKRDLITWNVMIGAYAEMGCGTEAYKLFVRMEQEGVIPNAFTYANILNAAAASSPGALDWVKEVHSHALKARLESDLRVGNALVLMYAKSGSINDARVIFDRMEKRDVITWNIMIGAYAERGCGLEAYQMFLEMERQGFKPDAFTYASIVDAAPTAGALEWVKEVHRHAFKAGLESHVLVGTALVRMYAKSGSIDEARLVFDRMGKRDLITWNAMIGAYAEMGCGMEAYKLFGLMKREGFTPNAFTFVSILNSAAAASPGALEWVKEVHGDALKGGLASDFRVGNALVHMYAKIGSTKDFRLVFDRMEKRDVSTWNAIIGAYADCNCGVEAYGLFLQMEREGFVPDAFTYASIVNAAPTAGGLDWVKVVHTHACKAGLESHVLVGTALVRMYAKTGSINDAQLVFDRMEERDVVTWNVMIGGLAQHGRGHEALNLFERMNAENMKPDEITLVAVLSGCSHSGLVDDGRRIFSAMKGGYGVEASAVHYNCMVDALGRAGHLDEAKLLIERMPMEPDAVTWTALLGACRTHCNVELGELAASELFKLDPKDSSAYVLLSNIYAAAGRWEKVESVRTMMQKRGVWKEPGRSWIVVDNKVHEFVVGDTSHPEATAIYGLLVELSEKLRVKGYSPDTRLVLHKINDEDKGLALCSHSEKLAIAYGLLRVPNGKPIFIEKNLRVCTDCHAATKLISEVTGREIIAKDANRFHHFKGGVCSCGDYW